MRPGYNNQRIHRTLAGRRSSWPSSSGRRCSTQYQNWRSSKVQQQYLKVLQVYYQFPGSYSTVSTLSWRCEWPRLLAVSGYQVVAAIVGTSEGRMRVQLELQSPYGYLDLLAEGALPPALKVPYT